MESGIIPAKKKGIYVALASNYSYIFRPTFTERGRPAPTRLTLSAFVSIESVAEDNELA